jgi:MFS family permease
VWRNAEFRALVASHAFSVAGDDLARIALAIVFFERTGSPLVAALTFSLSYLPSLLAGPLLSTFGDRFERRRVMVVCDVARAALITAAACSVLLDWPIVTAFTLVLTAAFFSPAFDASRAALIPQVVSNDQYVAASVVTGLTYQLTQIGSYLAGAVAVSAVGGGGALLIDAGTFVLSAVALIVFVERRPHAEHIHGAGRGMVAMMRTAVGEVWARPVLRSLLLVSSVTVAGAAVPEGLAIVYASRHGLHGLAQGAMVAALPIGAALGGILLARYVARDKRIRWIRPCAWLAPVPLVLTAVPLPPAAVFALWTCAGLLLAFHFAANAAFMLYTPQDLRARAMGLAQSLLTAAQVLGLIGGGLLAAVFDVRYVVGIAGAITAAGIALPLLRWPTELRNGGTEVAVPFRRLGDVDVPDHSASRVIDA